MKIIFVISAMNGGGAERVIATLANHYAAKGDDITILMTAGDESAYPLDERVKILSIGKPSRGNPLIQIKRLYNMRRYFKSHKDSKIVSFGTQINLFTILSCLGLKNKVIVSERNDPNQCRFSGLRNAIYAWADGFVFQTEDARACFSRNIGGRSAVIPNPIRRDLPDVYAGEREKKIAAVGRLEEQKNHKLLLEAFCGFHSVYPEYELHIFGKGSLEKELKEKAEELGIAECVFFEGFVRDILEKIRIYAMYVLSSDYEGISNSLLEAMALGLPCISTDCPIGGSRMSIESGVNGLLTAVGDKAALQAALEKLAQDTPLADRLGRNAAEVRETFAEERIANLWREFIVMDKQ